MKSYTDLSSPVVARWMCVCKKKQNKKYMVTIRDNLITHCSVQGHMAHIVCFKGPI